MHSTKITMEHSDLLDRIKAWVRCFKCNYNVQRYKESKNLKDCLHFRIVRKEYEAKVAALAVSFKDFHRNHVDIELSRRLTGRRKRDKRQ